MDRELEQLEKELEPTLTRYLSSTPSTVDTRTLISQLQHEFNTISDVNKKPSFLKQLRNQWRTYPLAFWLVSIVAFALLTFALPPNTFRWEMNTYTIMLPLFLLVSILYSYKSWNKEMRMVEMVTPFPPALLLYLRMFISVLMVVIFGLAGTILSTFEFGFTAWSPFVLTWLAPILFLSGLLAYLSFMKGVKTGFIVAAIAWFILNVSSFKLHELPSNVIPVLFYMVLLLLGVGLLVIAYRKAISMNIHRGALETNAHH